MKEQSEKTFASSIRGKILITALVGVIALGAAWLVTNLAFSKMLGTVQELSEPNAKLEVLNEAFLGIAGLNRFEELNALSPDSPESMEILTESDKIFNSLDSLQKLCADNEVQLMLIDSVQQLLVQRNEVLENYLDIRKRMAGNEYVNREIALLEEIVANPMTDSLVLTTAHKIVTTIVKPSDTITIESESQSALKEMWQSLTRKNKRTERAEVIREEIQREEEISTQVDTLVFAQRDSVLNKAKKLINSISQTQKERQEIYFAKETELVEVERSFMTQLLNVLSAVEQEVIKQNADNTASAQSVVTNSVRNISIILLVFFIVTFILIVLILTDIAKSNTYRLQLVKAKEEAEFHSMARQRFLSNMSHEIRTPLQSIIGYAEQLQEDKTPQKDDIKSIYGSASHLLQIVNEVLDYNRINSGKFTFEQGSFDMHELLREVILNLKPQVFKKDVKLILDDRISSRDNFIGDAFRLKQILFNLLGNAIKFTHAGHVKLIVSEHKKDNESKVHFEIEDTGIGIESNKIEKIFSHFEQADATVAQQYGGSGLGLSIVKALVNGQDGNIQVESTPGVGSKFSVHLTFKREEVQTQEKKISKKNYSIDFDGVIWLVDDDRLIAKLCSTILSKYEIAHQVFHTAEDFLAAPWDENVRLVFTDIRLPGMSGLELCKELREKFGETIKIAAITAEAILEERERILRDGFDFLLVKPFNEKGLVDLIRNLSDSGKSEKGVLDLPPASERFVSLRQMTMGDEDLLKTILEQFVQDSKNDANELQRALNDKDRDTVALVLHRLAGRTAQAGERDVSDRFRDMEINLHEGGEMSGYSEKLRNVLKALKELVQEAEKLASKQTV